MSYKLCKACGQPIKPGRHKPEEYRHASGCPQDRSKWREHVIEVMPDGTLRDLQAKEVRTWRKRIKTSIGLTGKTSEG